MESFVGEFLVTATLHRLLFAMIAVGMVAGMLRLFDRISGYPFKESMNLIQRSPPAMSLRVRSAF